MADLGEDFNPYEVLGIDLSALDKDVKKAYRTKSITVHPDKNPSPDAAQKFFELTQAYELLLDPTRRSALDAKLKIQEARKVRFAAYDSKRKAMMEELDGREKEFKKAKVTERREKDARQREEEQIKDEGRRLMKQREEILAAARKGKGKEKAEEHTVLGGEAPIAGPLDTTVRLKYSLNNQPSLSTKVAVASLFATFGAVDSESVVFSVKPNKKNPTKPGRNATALVPFMKIGDAFSAVMASGRKDRNMEGIEILWAGGSEPDLVKWLKEKGELGRTSAQATSDSPAEEAATGRESGAFSSFPDLPIDGGPPSGLDYESLTFMRMREAARERLEKEILAQEAGELS